MSPDQSYKPLTDAALRANQAAGDKVIGPNKEEHEKKLKWLQNKWYGKKGKGDSEPRTVVNQTFKEPISPFAHAMVDDNVEYFTKQYYKKGEGNPNAILALACLCGARKIAEFLLEELNTNYLSDVNKYMLSYIAASQNIEWTKDVAHIIAKAGRELPAVIMTYAGEDIYKMVEKIFEENKQKTNTKPNNKNSK